MHHKLSLPANAGKVIIVGCKRECRIHRSISKFKSVYTITQSVFLVKMEKPYGIYRENLLFFMNIYEFYSTPIIVRKSSTNVTSTASAKSVNPKLKLPLLLLGLASPALRSALTTGL